MSTRETAKMRRETFALGVNQISAGSKTNPGGYEKNKVDDPSGQFSLGDHRPLDEVISDVASMGYIPSFCTACYRLGRTGQDFMDLAKPGDIKLHCAPNALSSFKEYLQNYGSLKTSKNPRGKPTRHSSENIFISRGKPRGIIILNENKVGNRLIQNTINEMSGLAKQLAEKLVKRIEAGRDDVYC